MCIRDRHIGHKKVIGAAIDGKTEGLIPSVLTFSSNPLMDLGGSAGGEIMTQEQKIKTLRQFGVEQLYILEFNKVKDMTAEEFVERVLAGICHAKKVCCGFNFHFGRGGRADSAALAELCDCLLYTSAEKMLALAQDAGVAAEQLAVTMEAVSYTHLDVYKRQLVQWMNGKRSGKKKRKVQRP